MMAVGIMTRASEKLALLGGTPIVPSGFVMRSRWPLIEPEDVERIVAQLRSGLLIEMLDSSLVRAFEAEIGSYLRAGYVLTTNSGTSALHCALAGVGVEPGDEVVVPALSYIACAAAVIHHQAIPIFADVDPQTFNVTPATIEAALTGRTKAVMVVHLHGLPADIDAIRQVTNRRGIALIEDFSQAFGARWRGRLVGSLGTVGAASLMAGKNLAGGGEGGVLVTAERTLRNRAAQLKCFAEEIDPTGAHRLLHETLGWNYRISLLSLVLASQQLFRLDEYNSRRRLGALELDATLASIPGFTPPLVPAEAEHVYHMYRFRFEPKKAGLSISADQAREALRQVFWNEGLPLVEFQNCPLPGHALLQRKVGYGRGCPWTCQHRDDVVYRIDDYPSALDVIRHSLIVGAPSQAPLCNPELVANYARCFRKVHDNFREFERFAATLPSRAPWEQPPRLF